MWEFIIGIVLGVNIGWAISIVFFWRKMKKVLNPKNLIGNIMGQIMGGDDKDEPPKDGES